MSFMLEVLEEDDIIFMKDGAKIHMGKAKEVRKRLKIKCSNSEEPLDGWYQAASVKLKILPGQDSELRSPSK